MVIHPLLFWECWKIAPNLAFIKIGFIVQSIWSLIFNYKFAFPYKITRNCLRYSFNSFNYTWISNIWTTGHILPKFREQFKSALKADRVSDIILEFGLPFWISIKFGFFS